MNLLPIEMVDAWSVAQEFRRRLQVRTADWPVQRMLQHARALRVSHPEIADRLLLLAAGQRLYPPPRKGRSRMRYSRGKR